jgi:hypothetical protein
VAQQQLTKRGSRRNYSGSNGDGGGSSGGNGNSNGDSNNDIGNTKAKDSTSTTAMKTTLLRCALQQ